MTNPITSLLDLASQIEDFPEDVSGSDAVKAIRVAAEALDAQMTEAHSVLKVGIVDARRPSHHEWGLLQREAIRLLGICATDSGSAFKNAERSPSVNKGTK